MLLGAGFGHQLGRPPRRSHGAGCSGAAVRGGCLFQQSWGAQCPQFRLMALVDHAGASPSPAPAAPRGGCAVGPRAKGHRGGKHVGPRRCKSGTEPQVEPSLQDQGGCSHPHPPTQDRTPVPRIKPQPGHPHAGDGGDLSLPPPWAQAGLSNDKSQPQAACQGQPWHHHEHSTCVNARGAGANLPPSTALGTPGTSQHHPAGHRTPPKTPAPIRMNPGVTEPGQLSMPLRRSIGYKHPEHVGR